MTIRASVNDAVASTNYSVDSINTEALNHLLTLVGSNKAYSNIQLDVIRSDQFSLDDVKVPRGKVYDSATAKRVNGNKLFKLLPNLQYAKAMRYSTIASFGGSWSNNIHALAMAASCVDMNSLGVIRGERQALLSDTLVDVCEKGMKLIHVPRNIFLQLSQQKSKANGLSSLVGIEAENYLFLPSGASNELAILGCKTYGETLAKTVAEYDELWMACGTGATYLGIVTGLYSRLRSKGIKILPRTVGVDIVGNPALKVQQNNFREACREIGISLLSEHEIDKHGSLVDGAAGGYARTDSAYKEFYSGLRDSAISSMDHVYMGKLLYSLCRNIVETASNARRIVVLHTGGHQGARGCNF